MWVEGDDDGDRGYIFSSGLLILFLFSVINNFDAPNMGFWGFGVLGFWGKLTA